MYPTAVQAVAAGQEIALKELKRLPPALGEDCSDQAVPFQESARVDSSSVRNTAVGLASEPAAMQEVDEMQETSRRIASPSLPGWAKRGSSRHCR